MRRVISPAVSMRNRMLPTVAGSISQQSAMSFCSCSPCCARNSGILGCPGDSPRGAACAETSRFMRRQVFIHR